MKKDHITLKRALKIDKRSPKKVREIRAELEKHKEVVNIATLVPWDVVEDKITGEILTFFNLPLANLCVGGWKKYAEIRRCAQETNHPKAEPQDVPLLEHEIVSEHHPRLEISIGGIRLPNLEFDLNVALKLEGAVLKIGRGSIKSVRLGKCGIRATLSYKDLEILSKESEELSLGKPINLGKGVRIDCT